MRAERGTRPCASRGVRPSRRNGGARREARIPGLRLLAACGLACLLAGGAGCGGTAGTEDLAPVPRLPPPEIPPPPPLEDTVYLGFTQERIELVEGESAALAVAFEPVFPRGVSGGREDALTFDLLVEVEPGSGSAADVAVSGAVRVGDFTYVLRAGTTWLGLRALVDELAEPPETLRLRLSPALPEEFQTERQYPTVFEFTNEVLEVELRDGGGADRCRNVRISASPPRRASIDVLRADNCLDGTVYETEVTVEADRTEAVQLDRITSHGRISDWRVGFDGGRVRHDLTLQWRPEEARAWEMRVQPCASAAGGPTLVCTVDSCAVYPAGSRLPPTRRLPCVR